MSSSVQLKKIFSSKFNLIAGLLILVSAPLKSQNYGLGFYSHNVSKDLRTELDLNPGKYYKVENEFELAFSLIIRSGEANFYGYVCRIISANNVNVDLIFNYDNSDTNYFRITSGQNLILNLSNNFHKVSSGWVEYILKFNLASHEVTFITPDTAITGSGLEFNKKEDIKILFGASDFGQFKTTDTPPMNLRDVKFSQRGMLKHHWPLDEVTGNSAGDLSGGRPALTRNPNWIKLTNYNWENIYETELDGISQVAFDPENENVLITGGSRVISFNIGSEKSVFYQPKNRDFNLLNGRQSFYDPGSKKLYSYDIDKPSVTDFDFNRLTWSGTDSVVSPLTVFGHHNKYYSKNERTLYVFGGYGMHRYKNTVQQYNLRTNKLNILKTSGDFFSPRYLSALGELNDTIYIMGGYGSRSGDQTFNPQEYYDMMAFSLKDNKFEKRFEFTSPLPDMAFANSMYIDPVRREYYALAFPIFKYDGYLQLIKGSLSGPDYSLAGSRIPYFFIDRSSFADLYYAGKSNKLIAVTILSENLKSKIKVFSLSFPPNYRVEKASAGNRADLITKFYIAGGVILLMLSSVGAYLFYFRKRRKDRKPRPGDEQTAISADVPMVSAPPHPALRPSSVLFFGGFHVIDKEGNDITRKFSPLLKELFLYIWFNSSEDAMGVSNEDLIEVLWFDLPETRARNNKAVNMTKLRSVLDKIGYCELSNKTGYWKIECDNGNLYNDYFEFLKFTNSKKGFTKTEILHLIEIVHGGTFLHSLKYEWLDEISSNVSNQVIDKLLDSVRGLNIEKETDLVITLAELIFKFDNTNEEALVLKCKALTLMGRHTIAINVFNKFTRDYQILFGAEFDKQFADIIK
jgi:DNA-binding SARP family transcriptional activator